MTTSGPAGLRAEEAIGEALNRARHDASRQLWATVAVAHALLSISGQLGEIVEQQGRQLDTRIIGFAEAVPAAGPLVECGAVHPDHPDLTCAESVGHLDSWPKLDIPHGRLVPIIGPVQWREPGYRDPVKFAMVAEQPIEHESRVAMARPYVAAAAPASLADGDLGAPATGPMPAVIP